VKDVKPRICYLVCATPRSGSTFLSNALALTKLAGNPAEFFLPFERARLEKEWGVSGFSDYTARLVRETMTPNGVFGFKVMLPELEAILDECGVAGGNGQEALNVLLPNLHYVHVMRRDKVRQAVSVIKARQSNVWHVEKGGRPVGISGVKGSGKLRFSFREIYHTVDTLETQDRLWQRHFRDNGITPYAVVYEDFVEHYGAALCGLLRDFLGIKEYENHLLPESKTVKLSDAVSERWVVRYRRMVRFLFLNGAVLSGMRAVQRFAKAGRSGRRHAGKDAET